MIKFINLFIFTLSVLCTSCKTLSFTEFRPTGKIANSLPALESVIDIRSLENAYSLGSTVSSGIATSNKVYGSYVTVGSVSSVSYADKRVQDAITLFEREVKDNLTDPEGDKSGYIAFKISNGGGRESGYGLAFLSGLTCGVLNLCGMSFYNIKTKIEIEVEILDSNQNIISRYVGLGYQKSPIALWRGYNPQDAYRKSNIEALKKAMNDVKEKISAEYEFLNDKLTNSEKTK